MSADPVGGRSLAASAIQAETDSHIWHRGICAQLLHACATMAQPAVEGGCEAGMISHIQTRIFPARLSSSAQVWLMHTCGSCPSVPSLH